MAKKIVEPEKDMPIAEAKRYLENAKKILSEKAGKQEKYYTDKKYVRVAGNTAWNGVLIALNATLPVEKTLKKDSRPSIDTYKTLAKKEGYELLNLINEAYNHLHLYMGYDGVLAVNTVNTAMSIASDTVAWCESRIKKPKN